MAGEAFGFQNIIAQKKAFSQEMPLPSKYVSTETLPLSHKMGDRSATVQQRIFIHEQYPEPAPSGVGSTDIFIFKRVTKFGSAVIRQKTFLEHYPEPLPSKLGTTHVQVLRSIISQNKAIIHQKVLIREHYPEPLPSKIGEEDLPGGFKREAVMTGQKNPLYDFARGIIQIDDVKVLFDAQA